MDPVPGLGGLWVCSLISARGFALESPQQGIRKHKRVALMGSLVKEVTLRSPNSEIKLLGPERRLDILPSSLSPELSAGPPALQGHLASGHSTASAASGRWNI